MAKLRHVELKAQLDQPEMTYVPNRRSGSKLHQIYGIELWISTVTDSTFHTPTLQLTMELSLEFYFLTNFLKY